MRTCLKKVFLYFLCIAIPIAMKGQEQPKAHIDYSAFLQTSDTVYQYRKNRLIPVETFMEYQKDPSTIVLDTRSAAAYQKKHIKGAVHLNFSDFTTEKLAKVIPSKTTRILIYCNNNIEDDPDAFPTKKMPLALNIPTFINLYGYGYKNVYELASLVSIANSELVFSGTAVE